MTIALPGPQRLADAVSKVVEAHPYAAHGAFTLSPRVESDAASLWGRLLALRAEALDEAIDELHPIEIAIVLATARQRLEVPGAPSVLARLLERRRPGNATALAWDVFLHTDGHRAFRALATEHVRHHGGKHTIWDHLVREMKPSEVVIALYQRQPQQFETWIASTEVALADHPTFPRRLLKGLLGLGELARLDRREVSTVIEKWVQLAIPLPAQEAWYARFLEETMSVPRPVDHAVLRAILDRFGEPATGRPFWSKLSDPARRAFDLWFTNARLTQLLGEGERVDFWRCFLPQIKRPFHNSDRRVVFIDLGVATAVQFVESGTATYIFPSAAFRAIHRGEEADVRRSVYDNAHKAAASYEHRGYSWRFRAEATVRQVLTELAYA